MTDSNQALQSAVATGASLAVLGVGLGILQRSVNQTRQPVFSRRKVMRKNPLYG